MDLKFTLLVVGLYSFLCCFTNISALTFLGDPCTNPEGREGTCIGLRQCPTIKRLLTRQSITDQIKKNVRKLACGPRRGGSNPHICCINPEPSTIHPNKHLINAPTCGLAFRCRILGGVDADLGEFPWMALLEYSQDTSGKKSFGCGGSLINDRYVLTAAHCITPGLVSVRLGEHNTKVDVDCSDDGVCAPPVQDITINETIVHEGYLQSESLIVHDIALIRLSRPVIFNSEYVRPICLPVANTGRNLDGKKLTVAGWGRTNLHRNASSDVLQQVKLPVVANAKCALLFKKLVRMTITAHHLCAGGSNKTQDACNGDSGGPLITIRDPVANKYIQYGIVSFGLRRCGTKGYPGVYTRVAKYIHWILYNIRA